MIMHSGTKYFGGHSDLLCGILVTPTLDTWTELAHIRTYTGSMMGSLEAWLLLRSLRTLHLRVPRQSENAAGLAQWLAKAAGGKPHDGIPAGVIEKVLHSSVQGKDARGFDPKTQLEGGWNATFGLYVSVTAISEQSVGVEDLEDLKGDSRRAFREIIKPFCAKL